MSRPLKDRTGNKVGRLTVLHVEYRKGKSVFWRCRCECGKEVVVASSTLNPGGSISCGCAKRERAAEALRECRTHGQSGTRLYTVWREMRYRCNNPKSKPYPHYGGRGIKICKEWEDFEVFRSWALSNGYSENLTIDRRDNDGDYTPENCRWATWETQNNNRRTTRLITYGGKTMSASQWAREIGVNRETLFSRIRAGKPASEILKELEL